MSDTVKAIVLPDYEHEPGWDRRTWEARRDDAVMELEELGATVIDLTEETQRVLRNSGKTRDWVTEWSDVRRFVSEWEASE